MAIITESKITAEDVNTALNEKADIDHTQSITTITDFPNLTGLEIETIFHDVVE